jgi:hypothetical protein
VLALMVRRPAVRVADRIAAVQFSKP